MISNKPVTPVFREGDEVVLAAGSHKGTLGVFLRLRTDVNWADITERNGSVRSHPVVWLAYATVAIRDPRALTPTNDAPAQSQPVHFSQT